MRSLWKGTLWTLVGLAILFHVAGGWYFSGELIEDAFVPSPAEYEVPGGVFQIEEVGYQSPLGEMDALYLPAAGSIWVIHIHGKGATPAEAEPLFTPLQDAGYPQLAITYRNDEGQPPDPSGYYQYGDTEWEDVAAAVDYALANGADKVVLSGFSTGAAHAMSFMFHRTLDTVAGVLMDSPNLDFGETVNFNAAQRELPLVPANVPPSLTAVAKFLTSMRLDVNWKALDYVDKADLIVKQPVLIHHGTDDQSVPISVSVALVEAKPDLVRLIQVEGAEHVGSYDVDLEKYVAEVLSFLDQVG
jgi:uncharacterized protein